LGIERDGLERTSVGCWGVAQQTRLFDVVQIHAIADLVHMEGVREAEIRRIGQTLGREVKLGVLGLE